MHTQRAANVVINMIVPWNAKNHFVAAMCGIALGIVARASSFDRRTAARAARCDQIPARCVGMGRRLHSAVQQR
jgi:hypothetical protein